MKTEEFRENIITLMIKNLEKLADNSYQLEHNGQRWGREGIEDYLKEMINSYYFYLPDLKFEFDVIPKASPKGNNCLHFIFSSKKLNFQYQTDVYFLDEYDD